jgi:hypothetical protein
VQTKSLAQSGSKQHVLAVNSHAPAIGVHAFVVPHVSPQGAGTGIYVKALSCGFGLWATQNDPSQIKITMFSGAPLERLALRN